MFDESKNILKHFFLSMINGKKTKGILVGKRTRKSIIILRDDESSFHFSLS